MDTLLQLVERLLELVELTLDRTRQLKRVDRCVWLERIAESRRVRGGSRSRSIGQHILSTNFFRRQSGSCQAYNPAAEHSRCCDHPLIFDTHRRGRATVGRWNGQSGGSTATAAMARDVSGALWSVGWT